MKKLALHWKILIAMVLGVIYALISGYLGLNKFTINWIDPFGTIFINALKFIAIPLVLFSIITGVSSLGDVTQLGRLGFKTLSLYLITTIASVSLGLGLVNLIKPGEQTDQAAALESRISYELWRSENNIPALDEINSLTPENKTAIDKVRFKMNQDTLNSDYQKMKSENTNAQKIQNDVALKPLVDIIPENIIIALSDPSKMLQVIMFAIFFGICMSLLPRERTKTVFRFFDGMNEIFVKMVDVIMVAAPFFVFCLMAGVLAKMASTPQEIFNIFKSLSWYTLTVLIGLAILLFLFYPLIAKLFGVKISFSAFFRGLSPAQFLAFSTSSSAATLPVTIECVEENLKVPKRITDFVLPIGATVNMDGTSLYQAVAVIFLAQFHGVDLTLAQQLGIIGTTTLASIGAAAVPGAGLIMLMIVLTSVGLNPLWVTIIYPVDRILDMCRTVVNVTSDATVSLIVAKTEEGKV